MLEEIWQTSSGTFSDRTDPRPALARTSPTLRQTGGLAPASLDRSDPATILIRTSPILDRSGMPEDRFIDVKTDPFMGWARTVPLAEKYWHLVHVGALREDQLNAAVRAADRAGVDVEDVLIYSYRLAPGQIGAALAQFYGCPYEPFQPDRKRPESLLVDHPKYEYLLREGYVPLRELQDGTAVVLALNPTERPGGKLLGKRAIAYAVTTRNEFFDTLRAFFGRQEQVTTTSRNEHWSSDEINQMILDAWRRGCSDIHIEARTRQNSTRVRLRKDGSLIPYREVSMEHHQKLVNRLKHMCSLDTTERRLPQDGKIAFKNFGPADIELRVATIPTAGGFEDVVMRLLSGNIPIPLDRIELSTENLDALQAAVAKPHGLFLVCGPTGSGKTTTLHAILHRLNEPRTKIWTAEDPVEISHEGLCQVQIQQGLTFAGALRTFLRADPDVIMVGEMRDQETASIAIEASLTGHLVLSTLHTNSAPETVTRLLEMGIDSYLIADGLLGVLAQRLTKRLCVKCRQPHAVSPEELKSLMSEYSADMTLTPSWQQDPAAAEGVLLADWKTRYGGARGAITRYEAGACEDCSGTGYNGRIALHELLIVNDEVKHAIQERARSSALFNLALATGMRTLRQDGILKVLAGHTDLKQVHAVCAR